MTARDLCWRDTATCRVDVSAVAQGLELLHADAPDAVSTQLAKQYARGGRGGRAGGRAVAYYRRAADLAAAIFAHDEAIRLHHAALSIVRALPDRHDRTRQELGILEVPAAPLNARHGYASPELADTLERSNGLAEALGRRDSLVTGLGLRCRR